MYVHRRDVGKIDERVAFTHLTEMRGQGVKTDAGKTHWCEDGQTHSVLIITQPAAAEPLSSL